MKRYRIRSRMNNKTYYIKTAEVDERDDGLFTQIFWTTIEEDAFLYPEEVAKTTVQLLSQNGHYYDYKAI